jgi:hypothetical protein
MAPLSDDLRDGGKLTFEPNVDLTRRAAYTFGGPFPAALQS